MWSQRAIDISTVNNILLSIQPIPETAKRIWQQTEYYLVDRINEDVSHFFNLFVDLCKKNRFILDTLGQHKFSHLMTTIDNTSVDRHICELLVSHDRITRILGIRLFHEIKVSATFNILTLPKPDESILELLLWEFIGTSLLGNPTSKLLTLIEPLYRGVNPQLRNDFKNELVFQAINYPGSCLDFWKSLKTDSALIGDAIIIADKYFDDKTKVSLSSANSFGFPGLTDLVKYGARKFSEKIDSSVKEKSLLRMLARNIQVIYGDAWTLYNDGSINPPSGFQNISHSIEGPRIEEIDPEGMAIRRIHALSAINHANPSDTQIESQ